MYRRVLCRQRVNDDQLTVTSLQALAKVYKRYHKEIGQFSDMSYILQLSDRVSKIFLYIFLYILKYFFLNFVVFFSLFTRRSYKPYFLFSIGKIQLSPSGRSCAMFSRSHNISPFTSR